MSETVGNELQLAEDNIREAIKHIHNATSPECGEYDDYKQSHIQKLIGLDMKLRDILADVMGY